MEPMKQEMEDMNAGYENFLQTTIFIKEEPDIQEYASGISKVWNVFGCPVTFIRVIF